jgi:hypothetical protein
LETQWTGKCRRIKLYFVGEEKEEVMRRGPAWEGAE